MLMYSVQQMLLLISLFFITSNFVLCASDVQPKLAREKGSKAPGSAATGSRHKKLSGLLQKLDGVAKQLGAGRQ